MIKAFFLGLIKILGGTLMLLLLGLVFFLYRNSVDGGYSKGWIGVKYYYKENGADQWYYNCRRVKGADRSTFTIVESNQW